MASPQWTARRLTGAAEDEAWSFEADDGTNYRGWEYRTTAFLGYQPPLPHLRTVGVMYEGERLIGAAVDRARAAAPADFDPDFRTDRLSLLANLALGGDDGRGPGGVQRLPDGERDGGTRQSGVARRDRHTSPWPPRSSGNAFPARRRSTTKRCSVGIPLAGTGASTAWRCSTGKLCGKGAGRTR